MSVTRKAFFSGLVALLAAKAQTIITPCRPKIQWGNLPPPCNGQCPNPECSYRAPAFPNRKLDWVEIAKYAQPGVLYWDPLYPELAIPTSRLNRCPNCNAAFWQSPEQEAK